MANVTPIKRKPSPLEIAEEFRWRVVDLQAAIGRQAALAVLRKAVKDLAAEPVKITV